MNQRGHRYRNREHDRIAACQPGQRRLRRRARRRLPGELQRRWQSSGQSGSAISSPQASRPIRRRTARRARQFPLRSADQFTAIKGNTFAVNLLISGAQNVYSVPVQMNYDPENAATGERFQRRLPVAGWPGRRPGASRRRDHWDIADHGHAAAGRRWSFRPGPVVTLTFQAKASGQTPLTITRGGARDPGLQAITVNGAQASVTVQ